MQTPEELARAVLWDYDSGALEADDLADLIRAHDAAVEARALREAADEVGQMLADDSGCELNAEMLASMRDPEYLMAWLRVRASEREEGAS